MPETALDISLNQLEANKLITQHHHHATEGNHEEDEAEFQQDFHEFFNIDTVKGAAKVQVISFETSFEHSSQFEEEKNEAESINQPIIIAEEEDNFEYNW